MKFTKLIPHKNSILITFAFFAGLSSPAFAGTPRATATPVDELLAAPDEHTSAALKRAAQQNDLEKISSQAQPTPPAENSPDEVQVPAEDAKPDAEKAPHDWVPSAGEPGTAKDAAEAEVPKDKPSKEAPTDDSMSVKLIPKTKHGSKAAEAPAKVQKKNDTVNADTALTYLKNGNLRFVRKRFRSDGRSSADRTRLADAQKAHAIVLGCSDSRVPPELVFDQGLGEISVVRVAGPVLDPMIIASLESAVTTTGAHLLVILGHTRCEAIEHAVHLSDDDAASDALAQDISTRISSAKASPSRDFDVEAALNADGLTRDLLRRSKLIKEKVESGELVIKSALYRVDSGKVTFY